MSSLWHRSPSFDDVNVAFKPYVRLTGSRDFARVFHDVIQSIFCALVLFPIRVSFLVVLLLVAYALARISTIGIPISCGNSLNPAISFWRMMILTPLPLIARGILWCFSVWSIRCPTFSNAGSIKAPAVIVSNHLGYLDILVLIAMFGPCAFVARYNVSTLPFVGVIARALHTVFVGGYNEKMTPLIVQRARAIQVLGTQNNEISTDFDRNEKIWSKIQKFLTKPVLNSFVVFPEGTTTNGSAMLRFRTGLFCSNVPVQPVVIRYPFRYFSPTWESIRLWHHTLRLMTQLYSPCEVHILPIQVSTDNDLSNPRGFADRVQISMAQVLNQQIFPLNRRHKQVYHSFLLQKISAEEALSLAKTVTDEDTSISAS